MVISNVTREMFEQYKVDGKSGNAESAFRVFTCSTDPGTGMPQDKKVAVESPHRSIPILLGKDTPGSLLILVDMFAPYLKEAPLTR